MNKKIIIILAVIVAIIVFVIIFTNNDSNISAYLYEENGLYGLKDESGKIIAEAKYKEIIKTEHVEDLFIVNYNNKYGIINSSGKVVIKEEYDKIFSDDYAYNYSKIGYILSLKKQDGYYFGYVDNKGKLLFDCEYEEVSRVKEYNGEDIYLVLRKNGRCGIARNGKLIIDMKYQDIFYNDVVDRFIVEKNWKYGVLNREGKELIKPEHQIFGVDGDRIYFIDGNTTIYYDVNGKVLNIEKKEL